MHESPQEEHSNSGSTEGKTMTELFDRFMDCGLKLGNDKEITTTLAASGTVGAAVGRDVWSKILGKTSVEKLIDKGSSFKLSDVQQEAYADS